MTTLLRPSVADIIREIEREQRERARVYPKLIRFSKLKVPDADHREACLDRAIEILRSLPPEEGS